MLISTEPVLREAGKLAAISLLISCLGIFLFVLITRKLSLWLVRLDVSYTPEGGSIEIRADIHSRKFYLTVANTGEPIPAELRERLFKRFYRQDEAREGSSEHLGLGLSIAENIVTKHHGKIRVESRDGKNIFCVVLPVMKK